MASRRPSGPFDQLAEYFADHPRALLSLQIVPPLGFVFFFVFVPLASIFAWSFWPVENNLLLLFAVPFLASYLLRTLSWYIVLQSRSLINTVLQSIGATNGPLPGLLFSEFSVHVGLLSTYLPFMIFPIWLAMSRIDQTVLA